MNVLDSEDTGILLLDLLDGHAPRYSSYVFCARAADGFCRVGVLCHMAPCLFSSAQQHGP